MVLGQPIVKKDNPWTTYQLLKNLLAAFTANAIKYVTNKESMGEHYFLTYGNQSTDCLIRQSVYHLPIIKKW